MLATSAVLQISAASVGLVRKPDETSSSHPTVLTSCLPAPPPTDPAHIIWSLFYLPFHVSPQNNIIESVRKCERCGHLFIAIFGNGGIISMYTSNQRLHPWFKKLENFNAWSWGYVMFASCFYLICSLYCCPHTVDLFYCLSFGFSSFLLFSVTKTLHILCGCA